jgi:hypothetical protein
MTRWRLINCFGLRWHNGARALSQRCVSTSARVSNELFETTEGLEITQEQAIDQLQVFKTS